MATSIKQDRFGELKNNGQTNEIIRFTVSNGNIEVQLITYGATITSLKTPGRNGDLEDIVLGFDDISSYIKHSHYFGATIGRFANRIAGGEFVLENKRYFLAKNNGPNHLHGGIKGFDKVVWDSKVEDNKVVFFYTSPSLEENYPGDLKTKVTYELKENELVIDYEATTNQPTPVNLTNHSYFNLAGHGKETIYNHVISINADSYTPVDQSLIPTGEIATVTSTKFDLRQPKQIGPLIQSNMEGFDHNFCVNGEAGVERKVASIFHPSTGRVMEIHSNQPGVQFYTSNCLPENDSLIGKEGRCYKKHGAFCLETQNFPNAINQKNFPNAVLNVNEIYNHRIRFCFSVENKMF